MGIPAGLMYHYFYSGGGEEPEVALYVSVSGDGDESGGDANNWMPEDDFITLLSGEGVASGTTIYLKDEEGYIGGWLVPEGVTIETYVP